MTLDSDRPAGAGPEREPESGQLEPIDLLLGQGSPKELQRCRDAMAVDPLLAVDFAETRQLVERLRDLSVEPGVRLQCALDDVIRQSDRRLRARQPTPAMWRHWAALAAAAAVLFGALALFDPLGLRSPPVVIGDLSISPEESPESAVAPPQPASVIVLAWDAAVRLGPGPKLTSAWGRFQRTQEGYDGDPTERLSQWLLPRNALAVMRLDYELRSTSAARQAALRQRGHMAAVDGRVQQLARELADRLLNDDELDTSETAMCVRALLAAGDDYQAALQRGGDQLVRAMSTLRGGELASCLVALGELAAATGQHDDVVRRHGERLLNEVVEVDEQTWTRRRPRLLSGATSAAGLGAAGRFLAVAPAFGIDPDQALFVRLLLAAHLQERRDVRNETPETLTALAYGFGDVLSRDEHEEVDARLRTWSPVSVVPDYLALHQLAGSRSPASVGYARFQLALRRIFALPTPDDLVDRAALCLCLAANFRPEQLDIALAIGE